MGISGRRGPFTVHLRVYLTANTGQLASCKLANQPIPLRSSAFTFASSLSL
jgi:hypothetical protein